jgi:hypothetical protein
MKEFISELKSAIPAPCRGCEYHERVFVNLLSKHGLLYHFDDDASDCLEWAGPEVYELVQKYTNVLYSDRMMGMAVDVCQSGQLEGAKFAVVYGLLGGPYCIRFDNILDANAFAEDKVGCYIIKRTGLE